jgi:hypothetical protein
MHNFHRCPSPAGSERQHGPAHHAILVAALARSEPYAALPYFMSDSLSEAQDHIAGLAVGPVKPTPTAMGDGFFCRENTSQSQWRPLALPGNSLTAGGCDSGGFTSER